MDLPLVTELAADIKCVFNGFLGFSRLRRLTQSLCTTYVPHSVMNA